MCKVCTNATSKHIRVHFGSFWHICTVFDKDEIYINATEMQMIVCILDYFGTLTATLRAPATLWNVLNTRFHAAVYARPAYLPTYRC